jgi:hypothetical protein
VVSPDGVSGVLFVDSCGVGVVEGTDVAGGGSFGAVVVDDVVGDVVGDVVVGDVVVDNVVAGGGFVGEAGGVYAIAFVGIV